MLQHLTEDTSNAGKGQVAYVDVAADYAGQRIDNFLHTHLKGVPRSHVYRILRSGEVRVNKGRIKPTYRLQTGDKIRLPPLHQSPTASFVVHQNVTQRLAQAVIYEDQNLLVIDKPEGMAVHGGSGISYGVIEGLRVLYPHLPHLELVHRLDRDTSGCLMIAKKRSVLKQLHEWLREGKIRKYYLALVQGQWQPQIKQVQEPLLKNVLQSGERLVHVATTGKPACSQFKIERQFTIATLLQVQPLTGRTHQIRVHTAHVGNPVAGDLKYGDTDFNEQMRYHALKRLFLHAFQLEIAGYGLTVQAPLPTALQQVLARLEVL